MDTAVLPLKVRRITPEATAVLRQNTQQMDSLSTDPEKADSLDKEFHLLLLDVCGNRPLRLSSHVIARLFDRAFRDEFLNEEAVLKSVRDHGRYDAKEVVFHRITEEDIRAGQLMQEALEFMGLLPKATFRVARVRVHAGLA